MSIHAGSGRTLLLAIFLFMSLVLTVSAACPETKLEVRSSSVTIDNPGALTPGMDVVISVRVDFPDKENTTFPETSQLELTSGLEKPVWTWYIVRNGVKKPETEERKSRVIISGDILSWPANVTESLEIELYGNAPSVIETKNLTVLRILDVAGTTCVGVPVYQYNAYVLNTTVTRERISNLNAELARLRADAAAKNRTGASTSRIMEKIGEAQQNLDTANTTPAFEFVSVAMALNRTESAIGDTRRLLEDTPVSGTMRPQQNGATVQKELPGASQQTPASPEPAAVPLSAILGAGIAVLISRRRMG
jgi:hypothetical protein